MYRRQVVRGPFDSGLCPYQSWAMDFLLNSSAYSRSFSALALALAAATAPACTPQTVVNTSVPAASAPVHGITVTGLGKVTSAPNIARGTVGVEARAGSADAAIAEVNARMAQVILAVKQKGVAAADVRTANLSLNFERSYEPPRPVEVAPSTSPMALPAAAPAGKTTKAAPSTGIAVSMAEPAPKLPQGFYTATNSVEVTIRNLDQAGQVLSAATSAGANQLYGIRFEIEDPTPQRAEARKHAVEDARGRAERLAQLAGVKLGPAVSITELDNGGGGGPGPVFAMMKSDASVPVERGELTVTSSVQIVYALTE